MFLSRWGNYSSRRGGKDEGEAIEQLCLHLKFFFLDRTTFARFRTVLCHVGEVVKVFAKMAQRTASRDLVLALACAAETTGLRACGCHDSLSLSSFALLGMQLAVDAGS